ncbi:unnamed protein product [Mytilus edulis]|uniref:SET domain-containing protein n=1 Tax=Mytilus edulis TaxID=6550 RepID=A0A8S3RD84_MYTED|nr:unnamed protein product [Mytilus edulis]
MDYKLLKTDLRRSNRRILKIEDYINSKSDREGFLVRKIDDIKGRGVFTTKPIEKGEFLFEYRGNLTTVDPGFNEYAFEFLWNSRKCWIDASNDDKSLGRLVNDDENDSNSIVKRIMVGGLPHLCFYAKRTISEGEEVTFTYFKGEYDQFPWRLKVSTIYFRIC